MGNGKVTRHRVPVILLMVIGIIILAGILMGVFAMPFAMSDGAGSIIKAGAEIPSLFGHVPDVTLELNPTDDAPPGSPTLGRAIAYSVTAFLEVVHWVIAR